ncbi:hypothetical protein [Actinomadura macrotermitis]|uniref:Uncharacterized protein n=1 Tax=Actinomadura macrotermitis TaxID=2585200 RepID=A0A7K0C8U6_9ACTN|nr:hypothetical protein [Actinomadura macrotermitis]MQY09860.1 hypothetical protein [Actinomadura macrotermitis]
MHAALTALNAVASAGTAGAGAARPSLGLRPSEDATTGVRFYAGAYAVRALPLGAATAFVLIWGPSAAVAPLLLVSGLAQIGDSALGIMRRNPGMAAGAGLCAVLHLLTAALWS